MIQEIAERTGLSVEIVTKVLDAHAVWLAAVGGSDNPELRQRAEELRAEYDLPRSGDRSEELLFVVLTCSERPTDVCAILVAHYQSEGLIDTSGVAEYRAHSVDLENELDTVEDARCTPYHEAGHAVAALRFGFRPTRASLVRDGIFIATVECERAEYHDEKSIGEYVIYSLAGWCAEVRADQLFPDLARGRSYMDFYGARVALGRTEQDPLDDWLSKTHLFVEQEWAAISAVAKELDARRILSGHEIAEIVRMTDDK